MSELGSGYPATEWIHDAKDARIAEMEAHEQQTHDILGAILGTDTSLEDGARRLEAERDALRGCGNCNRVQYTTKGWMCQMDGEPYTTVPTWSCIWGPSRWQPREGGEG